MNQDQITSLAKQAGFLIDEAPISQPYVIRATRYKIDDELQRFAELVLEEAAKVVEARFMGDLNREDMEVRKCVEAIRSLK